MGQNSIWPKRRREVKTQTALEKRISKIATPDIFPFLENSLYVIGRKFSDWTRHHAVISLEDALIEINAMQGLATELIRRETNE